MTTETIARPDDERLKLLWSRALDIVDVQRGVPSHLAQDHIIDTLTACECDLYRQMLDIPAASVVGIALKLKAAATFGGYGPGLPEDLVISALQDAERLAGGEGE